MHIAMNESALAEVKTKLDTQVKKVLAQKSILAHILQRTVEEFAGMDIEAIISCIEGQPQVGEKPVFPRYVKQTDGTEITGMQNENAIPEEGVLYYDIIFYVLIPKEKEYIKMIINVEAQKDFYPGYSIETRAVFYAAREISSQKNKEFEHSKYDAIKKCYSIWLCMDAPEYIGNAISEYAIRKRDILPGIPDNRSAYDKLAVIIVALNEQVDSKDSFMNLMNMLLSETVKVSEKKIRLENEYGISVQGELKEGLNTMCNYSDMIEEKSLAKGLEKGRILAYADVGMSLEEIAGRMELSVKEVEKILKESEALAMA